MAAIMKRATIPVICDDGSHAPKWAIVSHLPYAVDDGRPYDTVHRESSDTEELAGDRLLAPRGVYEYDRVDAWKRKRHVLECPLCGLRVELRAEAVERLTAGLVAAGVPSLRLAALAASV